MHGDCCTPCSSHLGHSYSQRVQARGIDNQPRIKNILPILLNVTAMHVEEMELYHGDIKDFPILGIAPDVVTTRFYNIPTFSAQLQLHH
jgi:hypothetical protein